MLSTTESTKLTNQPLRYAIYVYDTETELYYLQARYYDQDATRFISRDPDGGDKDNPLSQNAYAYGNADPVNNVDPDGKFAFVIPIVIGAYELAQVYITLVAATIVIYDTQNYIINARKNSKEDPFARPAQKKQSQEFKEKKKSDGNNWKSNPNKRKKPLPHHTPGRDHQNIHNSR